ncbi:MAG: DMT family transporter [Desulfobacterota bacterium]|nr:DMT family transporter [Thermodesulfobacteriota bacterium]
MAEKSRRTGYLLLTFVVLTWGANHGIVKSAFEDFPPLLFSAIRFSLSGLLVLTVTHLLERSISLRKEDFWKVFRIGLLGIGAYQLLWSVGLNLTTASNSALILSSTPLWGAIYLHLVEKEPVSVRHYLYLLLSLLGVALIVLRPGSRVQLSPQSLKGDLLMVVSSIFAAVFLSIWSRPLLKKYSPLRLMGYCMLFGSLVLWLAVPVSGVSVSLTQVGPRSWWALAYAVLLAGIVGHVSYYGGIERLGVTPSMVYLYLIPVWALLFNHLWMGERILIQQIFGGLLILIGVHGALRRRSP